MGKYLPVLTPTYAHRKLTGARQTQRIRQELSIKENKLDCWHPTSSAPCINKYTTPVGAKKTINFLTSERYKKPGGHGALLGALD